MDEEEESEVRNSKREDESLPIPRDKLGTFATHPLQESLAFRAAANDDLETLTRLLDGGYEVNTLHEENPDGPFFIINDYSRMIRQICLKQYTMLHVAVVHSSIRLIKYLIRKGADVNLSDVNRMSALSLSAVIKRPDAAHVLIAAGANVNVQSLSGRTPLIEAAANGCLPMVNLLIKAGCDLDLADLKDTTPLFTCLTSSNRYTKNELLINLIKGGVTVDHSNKQGATALMIAVGMGLKDAATVLLEAGANVNLCDRQGKTVIHLASGPNMVIQLMNWGASSDIPDKKGVRPLDRALQMGHIGLVRVFLGADCHRDYTLLDAPLILQMRQQFPAFDRWLLDELGNPRQLKRLCRQAIRKSLSPSNTPKIKDLPIPSLVKDFLLAKHLELTWQ